MNDTHLNGAVRNTTNVEHALTNEKKEKKKKKEREKKEESDAFYIHVALALCFLRPVWHSEPSSGKKRHLTQKSLASNSIVRFCFTQYGFSLVFSFDFVWGFTFRCFGLFVVLFYMVILDRLQSLQSAQVMKNDNESLSVEAIFFVPVFYLTMVHLRACVCVCVCMNARDIYFLSSILFQTLKKIKISKWTKKKKRKTEKPFRMNEAHILQLLCIFCHVNISMNHCI